MADHIGQIERRMIAEIEMYLTHYPDVPDAAALMDIPARPSRTSID